MSTKNFRTYFFSVHHDTNEAFEYALKNITDISNIEHRTEDGVRLLELSELNQANKSFLCGDVERIHMDNLPNKSGVSEEPDELDLEDDEGLGYNTAFVYYPAKKILGIQSNITGVSYSRLRDYINGILHKNNKATGFHINPIIVDDKNAQKVLNEEIAPSFKSISFTIENPKNFNFIPADEQVSIIDDIANKAKENNAMRMTVTLSAGREKENFLNKLNIMRLIKKGAEANNVKNLKARAYLDGGENTELNFLPNKLQYIDEITILRNQAPLRDRTASILRAFNYHSEYIESRAE